MQRTNYINPKSAPSASSLRCTAQKVGVSRGRSGRDGTSGAAVMTYLFCARTVRRSTLAAEVLNSGRDLLAARFFGIEPGKTVKRKGRPPFFVTSHDSRRGTGGPAPRCPSGRRCFCSLGARSLSSKAPGGGSLRPCARFYLGLVGEGRARRVTVSPRPPGPVEVWSPAEPRSLLSGSHGGRGADGPGWGEWQGPPSPQRLGSRGCRFPLVFPSS